MSPAGGRRGMSRVSATLPYSTELQELPIFFLPFMLIILLLSGSILTAVFLSH